MALAEDKALEEAQVVLVCLSKAALGKQGPHHRLMNRALARLEEQPEDAVFTIPVLLEACELPHSLKKRKPARLYEQDGNALLLKTLSQLLTPHRKPSPAQEPDASAGELQPDITNEKMEPIPDQDGDDPR